MTAPLAIIGQGEYATVIDAEETPAATMKEWRDQVVNSSRGIERLCRQLHARSGLVQFMVNQHKTDATIREIRHMAEATEALLRVMTHYVELVDAEVTE